MPIRKLTDSLYIAPQLTEADVQEAVHLGIQTVICNRPDGEEENQPAFAEVQNWFKEAGINQFPTSPLLRLKSTQPMSQPSKICCNNLRLLSLPSAVPAHAAPCFGVIIKCNTAHL